MNEEFEELTLEEYKELSPYKNQTEYMNSIYLSLSLDSSNFFMADIDKSKRQDSSLTKEKIKGLGVSLTTLYLEWYLKNDKDKSYKQIETLKGEIIQTYCKKVPLLRGTKA